MRVAILAVIFSAMAAFGREPTQQDYDIWAATLVSFGYRDVYVWHTIEPTSVFARGGEKGALESHPEFLPTASAWSTGATEIDIKRLNAALEANRGVSFREPPVKVLEQETLEKIVGKKPKPAWIVSPRLVEGVEAICRLSWPAVREDGRAAYMLCGEFTMWKGSICHTVINKKPDGRWSPGDKGMRDLLLWGPGWPEGTDNRLFIDE